MNTSTQATATGERADLLAALAKARYFLRFTVRDLTDDQARQRTTVSELSLGGLIKHVALTERQWANFILEGPSAMGANEDEWAGGFQMLEGETLAGLLDRYEQVARRTDELVTTLPDLDAAQPLPEARWSARQVLLHVVAETAQHSGHADIIRESLDGAKTMG
jgi:uncharacterized damage-inducible protein DinB